MKKKNPSSVLQLEDYSASLALHLFLMTLQRGASF